MLCNHRTNKNIIALIVVVSQIIILAACSGAPKNATALNVQKHENPPAIQEDGSFSKLPAVIREYLKQIADAFENHNNKFLIAQGEENYDKDLRGSTSEGQYLAMLYRAGPYIKDSTWQIPDYKLNLSAVQHIKWLSYREQGPVLEIEGIITESSGKTIPCRLMLLWRLNIPKIIGTYP
ncbi:hypothetical protein FACS1894190_05480 [Spirochaetia bacterium]|nr:hypothetical protein FACS1894190_05480 [Spirochaetia bacterium]